MEAKKVCPDCGGTEIYKAKLDINTKLYPVDALLKIMNGSEVTAEVCGKCGYILELRALKPQKLKK